MTTLKHKEVTIRKSRHCFGCLRKFVPGDKMVYYAGIFEGDFGWSYSCKACDEIMTISNEGYGFDEGFVKEWLTKDCRTPEQLLEELRER